MISLLQYLTEWKQDMMPQCVVLMGGPGAGKTYFMNNTAKKFFQNNITPRKLDSDWNLAKFQKEHVNKLCVELLRAILPEAASEAKSRKQAFEIALKQEQDAMDAAVDYGKISKTLDISNIDFNFVKFWADRYSNAKETEKENVLNLYKRAFMKEYFENTFASDFSVRKFSKAEYKKHFQQKLKGEVEGLDFVGPSDVIIAITGDELEKFKEIVSVCGETHNITVIYLDVPTDMSIRQDAERARSLGEKMVRKILDDVHRTWEELKDAYKGLDITKLVHMKTDPSLKHPDWKVEKEYINYELLKRG